MVKKRNSRIRLLIAGLSWPLETFLARLIRGLLDAGIHITLATARKPGPEWLSHPRLEWLHTPNWEGAIPGRFLRLARMMVMGAVRSVSDLRKFAVHVGNINGLTNQLRTWYRLLPFAGRRWDVIYFPWNSAAITYLPLFDLGMPVVFSCRGSQVNVAPHNPNRFPIRQGLRITFEKAAAVHCVSEAVKIEAMKYGLSPEKAWVIHPAVDPVFFRPGENALDHNSLFRVITIGNLTWVKGHEYALQTIRYLKDADVPVRFDILGDGPERQRLLFTIHDLGMENDVLLHGRVPSEQVRELLQQADVFLLSSLSEGISNAVLEAMACGLPVVTTDCGGMREAVTDGVEGFVVPVRDSNAIADALQEIWSRPEMRIQMGKEGRNRVLRDFALDEQINAFCTLLKTVTSEALPTNFHTSKSVQSV